MNKEIKKQWVAALRSGKYKQGRGKLRYGNQNGTFHCCLGVLTDLAVKAKVIKKFDSNKVGEVLKYDVKEWAGLRSSDPVIYIDDEGHGREASLCNDYLKFDFKKIANLINKNL